ncbi:MAG: sigma factor, partial [Phycisphaerales bacterium]
MRGLRVAGVVAQVVERRALPHRERVDPLVVGGAARLAGIQVVGPDVRLHAAAVALPRAVVDRVRRVRQPLAVGADGAVGAVGHGERLGQAAALGDAVEPRGAGDPLHAAGGEDQRAVVRPLVEHLARRVTRSTAEADDAVQEIFVDLWRSS